MRENTAELWRAFRGDPQRLKPRVLGGLDGAAEAAPFPEFTCESRLGWCRWLASMVGEANSDAEESGLAYAGA
jgi:hypothetical protein